MRPSVVVEVHGQSDCRNNFAYASEDLVLEQLVLHRVVDALCLGVVLWVSRLCHTDQYSMLSKRIYILTTGILTAAIRVVYKVDFLTFYPLQCHP